MRRINSVGSKNGFELSPIYTGHFRKPSRASAEPLTIEGMNAFVLRLMMRMPRGSLGVETMDTTARAQDSSPPNISTIGEDLTITGNVTSKGELHVNGRVQGDVHCVALVLGENAQVEGSVVAEDVMVRGRLIGSVRALRVMLQSTAYVEGNLFHKSLSLEQGTHFEGESRPSDDPLSIPEIHAAKPQQDHNGPEVVKQRERANGFIKSLPESLSA
jgi:cytoskeletal protein CcmA (bactofilin family)